MSENIDNQDIEYTKEVENVLEDNNYLENYLFAEYVIKTYISDEKSYLKGRFLRYMRITNKMLLYCEEVIKFLNPTLYEEYEICKADGEKRRIHDYVDNINEIVHGIKTGYLYSGRKFDELDFYKLIPFKDEGLKFVSVLRDFMINSEGIDDEAFKTIMNYLSQNKITEIIYINEKSVVSHGGILNNKEETPEVISKIFRYMRMIGLPKIKGVYMVILKKYLNHEIDFSSLGEREARARKAREEKAYKNPYVLNLINKTKSE